MITGALKRIKTPNKADYVKRGPKEMSKEKVKDNKMKAQINSKTNSINTSTSKNVNRFHKYLKRFITVCRFKMELNQQLVSLARLNLKA